MVTLTITRGLPGSGKTRFAEGEQAFCAKHNESCLIAGRDHLRTLMGIRYGDSAGENALTAIQAAMVRSALRAGVDVVVDDMNLHLRDARRWSELASRDGVVFAVHDLSREDVEECIRRDASRPAVPEGERWRPGFAVGAEVIRDKHRRLIAGKGWPLPLPVVAEPVKQYEPPIGKPAAILVDIDGTVALHVDRSPYDETRVSEDLPNEPILAAVLSMRSAGYRVIFMSGRSEGCRADTTAWLDTYFGARFEALHMRAEGDSRRDSVVKLELFDRHVRDHYQVALVFDDRTSVVQTWRDLGLTVAQVDEGDF